MTATRFRSWAHTHPGARRTHNEDSYVDRPDLGLWAVSDGAGGHQAGDLAAGTIAEALEAIPPGLGAAEVLAEIRLRIERVHTQLREEAGRRGTDTMIASTVVILVIRGEHFACLWAGDSRAYLMRDRALRQITHDHSLVQELVDSGAIQPEEAEGHPRANVITRAIGAGTDDMALDKVTDRVQPGDLFLLCSDGLTKTLPAETVADLLLTTEHATERLVEVALEQQASDNVTAVAVQVLR